MPWPLGSLLISLLDFGGFFGGGGGVTVCLSFVLFIRNLYVRIIVG